MTEGRGSRGGGGERQVQQQFCPHQSSAKEGRRCSQLSWVADVHDLTNLVQGQNLEDKSQEGESQSSPTFQCPRRGGEGWRGGGW